MDFGIASIPSNGTKFSMDLFKLPDGSTRHFDGGVSWHDFVSTRNIICPMRHPIEVTKTWRYRRVGDQSLADLWDCYDSLLRFEKHINFWFPIESIAKEQCLQRINEAMNCNFKTNWEKLGSSGGLGFILDGDEERAAPYIDFYDRIVRECEE